MDSFIRLIRDSVAGPAALDTAVSRALLMRASDGGIAETLRLYRPGAIVAFGRQDANSPGFEAAVEASTSMGFASALRLAGGRAAVFHEQTIAFARTIPDRDPYSRTFARFREMAEILAAALGSLGVDARIGSVPLEYCPGDYSINARGEKKLVGIGQRVVSKAAHVGGVIVVGGAHRISEVLLPVYEALNLKWDPETVGAVSDEVDVSWDDVEKAVLGEFDRRFKLQEEHLDEITLALARTLEDDHQTKAMIK